MKKILSSIAVFSIALLASNSSVAFYGKDYHKYKLGQELGDTLSKELKREKEKEKKKKQKEKKKQEEKKEKQ